MKFKSKAQFNLFREVAAGTRKVLGLSRNQATKDIKGKTPNSIKGLPTRVKSSSKKK